MTGVLARYELALVFANVLHTQLGAPVNYLVESAAKIGLIPIMTREVTC
jgi:hypothetical protein